MINPQVLRMLDANANRAREALRVMEDAARFALDDGELCGRIKALRHELAEALGGVLADAILCRDTPGDVGTDNKTTAEGYRSGLRDVVIAAGKRLGEALRVLEEGMKIVASSGHASSTAAGADHAKAPPAWRVLERLRYRAYELETRLAIKLNRGRAVSDVRLCVLITESFCRGPWLKTAEQAIIGGATCLQLREKEMDGGELLRRACDLVALCRVRGVVSIINDRPDIAILSGADGVHLGQQDLPCRQVRKLVGNDMVIGVSTHNITQARQAVVDGADYIGVGPVFPSATKPREFTAGLEYARQVAAEIPIPALAIAGIALSNVDQITGAGMRSVAVCSAVISAQDVSAAAAAFVKALALPMGKSEETDVQRPGHAQSNH